MFCRSFILLPRYRFLVLLSPLILSLTACSVNITSPIEVPELAPVTLGEKTEAVVDLVPIVFDSVLDGRSQKPVVVDSDGQAAFFADGISTQVRKAIESVFELHGLEPGSNGDSAIVNLEIRTWEAEVTGSFPQEVTAEAELYIEVLNSSEMRIRSGKYVGVARRTSIFGFSSDVDKALAEAMNEAILQVNSDRDFFKAVKHPNTDMNPTRRSKR